MSSPRPTVNFLNSRSKPRPGFAGQRVLDLGLPGGVLMVLIDRQGVAIVPSGSTVVLKGDKLLFSLDQTKASAVRSLFQA